MDKTLLSTTEAAKILGVSRIAVFKKIKTGSLKAKKIGRNYVIDQQELASTSGEFLSRDKKKAIENSVRKTVREYGEALRLLSKE